MFCKTEVVLGVGRRGAGTGFVGFFFSLRFLKLLENASKRNLNENLTKTSEKSTTQLKQESPTETLMKNTVILWFSILITFSGSGANTVCTS